MLTECYKNRMKEDLASRIQLHDNARVWLYLYKEYDVKCNGWKWPME